MSDERTPGLIPSGLVGVLPAHEPGADPNPDPTPHSWWWTAVAYLTLLRVPICTGLFLLLFPFAALLPSAGKQPFENFFVLGGTATIVTAFATFVVSWSVLLSGLVILLNSKLRCGISRSITQDALRSRQATVRRWLFGLAVILAAPMVSGRFFQREVRDTDWSWLLELSLIGAGAAAAYALAYAAMFLVMLLSPTTIDMASEIFPGPAWARNGLEWAHRRRLLRDEWPHLQRGLLWLDRNAHDVTDGYIDDRRSVQDAKSGQTDNHAYGLPWPGIWITAAFSALSVAAYVAIDYWKQLFQDSLRVPALGLVLLLLLNLNWFFCALSFFFDRFRVPLAALFGAAVLFAEYPSFMLYVVLVGSAAYMVFGRFRLPAIAVFVIAGVLAAFRPAAADGYYRLFESDALKAIAPYEVLARRVADHKPIIIVTTAGGGIQANAWTVRVLTGLQAAVKPGSFADSVAMVSSVSGGATGALFFLNEYRPGADPSHGGFRPANTCGEASTDALSCLVQTAEQPALDDVAWAATYRDVPGVVFPWLVLPSAKWIKDEGIFLDRGRMLELSWKERHVSGRLSTWQTGLTEGWRPASIFNATIAETGEPLLLSTTDMSVEESDRCNESPRNAGLHWRGPQPITFRCMYPHNDIELVTAARLASGFPWALPAPRALHQGDPTHDKDRDPRLNYHIVDGGYYDYYGVDMAVRWLDRALEGLVEHHLDLPPAVLFVQIRPFAQNMLPWIRPKTAQSTGDPHDPDLAAFNRALPREHAWFFQLDSPLLTLLHVRSSGQLLHDRDELLLLRDKWNSRSTDTRGNAGGWPRIRFAGFEFAEENAPLSFQMNPDQKSAIDKAWNKVTADNHPSREQTDLTQIRCMFDPSVANCPAVVGKDPW